MSRSWDIKVTQYNCGDYRAGKVNQWRSIHSLTAMLLVGPDGCLEYHTGQTGTIARYDDEQPSFAL